MTINHRKSSQEFTTEQVVKRPRSLGKAKVLKSKNDRSPIGRLPTEIIIMIVSLAGHPSRKRPYPWMVFSWVCHHWRLAILKHALFWKALVFTATQRPTKDSRPPVPLKRLYECSQNAPLDIMIEKKHYAEDIHKVIRRIPVAAKPRVKTFCIKTIYRDFPGVPSLSSLLSFFPSLENFFCDTFPLTVPETPCIWPPLRTMQIGIRCTDTLKLIGHFPQLHWLRLTYNQSIPLLTLLETLQNLPNLQSLIIFTNVISDDWRNDGTTDRIHFPKLTALVAGDSRVLHLIDAPALSFLMVIGYPTHVESAIGDDGFSHFCGFDFSKIDRIGIRTKMDQTVKHPCIRRLQIKSVISNNACSDLKDLKRILTNCFSGVNSIFDEFPTFYPNQFWLLSPVSDELSALLPVATTCFKKTPDLDQLILNMSENQASNGTEFESLLDTLRGTINLRILNILSGPCSWKTVCDSLSDGNLCPQLEILSYSANEEDEEMMENPAYIVDPLQVLLTGRSVRPCLKPLKQVELLGFLPIKPQKLKHFKKLGLEVIQGEKH